MPWYVTVIIFLFSCCLLSWLSSQLVKSLILIAKYLHWKEFIIAFFVMAFAVSLPNLFVDLNAVFHGMPELAFGDIIGGNLVDLTLVLAVAIFFSKKGIAVNSDMVQKSAMVTAFIAILPLLLVIDGRLGRLDGVFLILAFVCYVSWLFSKKERFKKTYKNNGTSYAKGFKSFLVNIVKVVLLVVLLLAASQAVVGSAQFFSEKLGISLAVVGILIVGLGNAFPEMYFSIISARKEENWLVLGDLMGSVIICSTLILGIIAIISPFTFVDFSPFLIARAFLIIAALISLIFIKTGRRLTKKEGLILFTIYIIFLIIEVLLK